MKKFLSMTLGILAFISPIKAQNEPAVVEDELTVVKVEPQLSDIHEVLKVLNINMYRFDLSKYLNEVYNVRLYVDEYENGKRTKEVGSLRLGRNIESLNKVPEKERDNFRKIKNVPEGKNEWDNIKELSLYISKPNDSTAMFTTNIPDVFKISKRVQLHPVGDKKLYLYDPRPFKFNPANRTDSINIPLVMYGSWWFDAKSNVIRMCGEKEIDPEMKAEILGKVPHYFVVGLELKKAGAKKASGTNKSNKPK